MTPKLIFYSGSNLLESPCWDKENNVLYCVSIDQNLIYRINPDSGAVQSYKTDGPVGCVAISGDGTVIEAEKSGIYRLNTENGSRELIAHCNYDEDFRYNDGKFDPKGRFLIGTKGDSKEYEGKAALYQLTDKTLQPIIKGVTISNGIAFSPDGNRMYYIDTPTKKVAAYKYDLETGNVEFEKYLFEFTDETRPDGMCERNGCLWVAEWGGGKVAEWNPETGEKLREIILPVKNVTSCCLGGENLEWLYITTAKSDDEDENFGGGLFRVKLGLPAEIFMKKLKTDFPLSFFYEEIRCDYHVSERMKKVWATEIDLYCEFARICEENNLKFYLFGGGLLGAARHKGFIPWDDDLDVFMPRKDYNKFCSLPAGNFKHPYTLLSPFNQSNYCYSYVRLANDETTCVLHPTEYCGYHSRVFIDIFALDKCKPETIQSTIDKIYPLIMKCSSLMRKTKHNLSDDDLERINKWLTDETRTGQELYNEIQAIASQYEDEDCDYLSHLNIIGSQRIKKFWKKEYFYDTAELSFENITVKVPFRYKEFLTTHYGDWNELPPIDERVICHNVIFEPDVPYKKYFKENYGIVME